MAAPSMSSPKACACDSCFVSSTEKKLYQCKVPTCPHSRRMFCAACATVVHRNIGGHSFLITEECEVLDLMDRSSHPQPVDAKSLENETIYQKLPKYELAQRAPVKDVFYGAVSNCDPLVTLTAVDVGALGAASLAGYALARYEYQNNQIVDEKGNKDEEEYYRRKVKSVSIPFGAFLCGTAAKLTVGAVTGGATGSLGLCLVGAAYGILGSNLSRKAFDKHWPSSMESRKELKATAIRVFGFFEQDVGNPAIFNKESIQKKYRTLAKKYHPDRNRRGEYGDAQKFEQLAIYHRVVLAMLEDDSVFPMEPFDVKSIEYLQQEQEQGQQYENDNCKIM